MGTAPRVTPDDLENEIASEHYFTAEEGVLGAYKANGDRYVGDVPNAISARTLPLLTFCVLVLHNGIKVTGESACVSPDNFDAGEGRKYARQNAIGKLWPLLGFRLADRLAAYPVQCRGEFLTAEDLAEAAKPHGTVHVQSGDTVPLDGLVVVEGDPDSLPRLEPRNPPRPAGHKPYA